MLKANDFQAAQMLVNKSLLLANAKLSLEDQITVAHWSTRVYLDSVMIEKLSS